jgi:citrate lyase subunit beta/citryl-CoA lyase
VVATSYLYVPGDRPERFEKALASGAGAVILDLEDAVAVSAKADARAAAVEHLRRPLGVVEQWVRVNVGDVGRADLDAVAGLPGLTGIFVPKATSASLDALGRVADVPRCALVESAATLLELPSVAGAAGVVALAMGEVDLAADLGIDPSPEERELWPLRMQVVVTSAALGLRAPIGPVHRAIDDHEGLRASTRALRKAGFEARQAIHPSQVATIQDVLVPTDEEVDRARELLRLAAAAGGGVCVDADGRMIDEAVLRSARRVLARRSP